MKQNRFTEPAAGASPLTGLYVVGALRVGHAQAIIAAGHGATAAIASTSCCSPSDYTLLTLPGASNTT